MNRFSNPRLRRAAAAVAGALALACAPLAAAQEVPAAPSGEGAIALPQAEIQKLLAAYALIKQNYVDQADDRKLFDGALAGMLAALDAHCQYLSEDDMRELDRAAAGEYTGIGVEVQADRGRMRVVATTEGGPAARAGIVPGDTIVAVDGVTLAGLPDTEQARRMTGAPGTVATVAVERHGTVHTLRIAREALHDTTVRARMAARGVAWIRVTEFGGATGADLAKALQALDGKTPPNGVILDLRNNPGGMVPAGVAVAGAFLPPGAVLFSARGREAGAVATVTVDPVYYQLPDEADVLAGLPPWTRTVPLAVLVNGASASAAELVAGALQDHRRATVIGTRTFGKGSIQSVIPLTADSGIKFTVARYFTPNGHEIQTRGVVPDIVVAPVAAPGDVALPRESDLPNHLPPTVPGDAAGGHVAAEPPGMFGTRDDKALRSAINLLKPADGRGTTLAGLLRKLAARLKGNGGTPVPATAVQ